jgi:diacylglycerol O-acyltransferase / wax synthase
MTPGGVRLSGRDAAFLYEERPDRPMHTVKVLELDGDQPDAARLRALLAPRIAGLAPLRRRVITVPGRLYHPVWVDAGVPDLGHHIRPIPCSVQELVSGVGAEPLDRNRPLWRIWLLDGGVIVLLLHHALGDARVSRLVITGLFGEDEVWPDGPADGESAPARASLVGPATVELARLVRRAPSLIRAAGHARGSVPTSQMRLPHGDAGRSCAFLSLPIEAVRRPGTTVTEAALWALSGACRELLLARAALPARSLTAAVPHALPQKGNRGNRIATLFVRLATEEPDDVARRIAISGALRDAVARQRRVGPAVWDDWWEAYPLRRLAYLIAMRRKGRVPFDLIVSSVDGGQERLARDGLTVRQIGSLGALPADGDCSVTTWSYAGTLTFGILSADGAALPAHELAQALQRELATATGSA